MKFREYLGYVKISQWASKSFAIFYFVKDDSELGFATYYRHDLNRQITLTTWEVFIQTYYEKKYKVPAENAKLRRSHPYRSSYENHETWKFKEDIDQIVRDRLEMAMTGMNI